MGWGNTLQSIASAILGGSSQAEQRNRDNPYSEENGGPGNSFAPWRGEEDDDPATELPAGRRSVDWNNSPEQDQPRSIPRWLSDPNYSVITPRGTTPSAPGPAQQDSTTKQDDADVLRIKDHLAKSMENLRRLEAINPNDKETMATYGHTKTYKPGTMKKRDGKMVDVGGQTKKDSVLMNIGKGLLASMKNIAPIMLDKNVDNRTALGYAIGAGAGGGIRYGMDGTIDEQEKLARDKERAQQQVTGAQGAYDADAKNRQTEANIDWTKARPGIEGRKIDQKEDATLVALYDKKTKRLKTLTDAIKSGTFDMKQNGQFMDVLADLGGVDEIKIGDFNPLTDSIVRTDTVPDAESGEVYTVTYSKGGKVVTEKAIDKATGQPIKVKSDRVKAAETQAQTAITTTGMRTRSAETIETMKIKAREALAKLGLDAKVQGLVYDEFVRLSSDEAYDSMTPDQIMQEALTAASKLKPQQ